MRDDSIAKLKVLLPVLMLLGACTTMQPVPPQTYLERNNPEAVRIYKPSGDFTVIDAPRLNGTVLSGFDRIEREESRIDLSQITRMEVKTIDKQKTALFVGGIALLAGAGIYMAANGGEGKGLICDNYQVDSRCYPRQSRIPVGLTLRF